MTPDTENRLVLLLIGGAAAFALMLGANVTGIVPTASAYHQATHPGTCKPMSRVEHLAKAEAQAAGVELARIKP